jgi:DNA-binding GntR family transcriptional regulator
MSADVRDRLLETLDAGSATREQGNGRAMVAECVRQWVFDGQLREGDAVSQEDLAEILGVSRIPVRDGLIALEAWGWVVMEPGRGARVVGLDAGSVRDSFELFGTIWSLLIRRAIAPAGRDRLARLAAVEEAVGAATSSEGMRHANNEFVQELQSLANAPRLAAAFRNASRVVPGNFFAIVPDAVETQRYHVPRIGRAIRRGAVDRATSLATALHASHARNTIALLATRGVLADEPAAHFST